MLLDPHLQALMSIAHELERDVHLGYVAAQVHGAALSQTLTHAEGAVGRVALCVTQGSACVRDLTRQLQEMKMANLKMAEQRDIAEATLQVHLMSEGGGEGGGGSSGPSPSSRNSSLPPTPGGDASGKETQRDVSKIADASAGEVQRLKNKLQNVANTVKQLEGKIAPLERNLAAAQNLARQREEENNRLQDRIYESEADARRKIEKLTTYTHNLGKDIDKKEHERDMKKAEVILLHQRLDEKQREIQNAVQETKEVRIENRKQLLVVESERRKSVEAHVLTKVDILDLNPKPCTPPPKP